MSPVYADINDVKSFPPTLIITAVQDAICEEGEEFKDRLLKQLLIRPGGMFVKVERQGSFTVAPSQNT